MLKLCILFALASVCLAYENDLAEKLNCHKLKEDRCPNINITFWLYNANYPNGVMIINTATHIPNFFKGNMNKPLKVLFHDFGGDKTTMPNNDVRPALLSVPDINVITVDYSQHTADPCYTEAVHNAYSLARCVSEFLFKLILTDIVKADLLHFIGVGIGAHLASFAANFLQEKDAKVGHITALDPAKLYYLTADRTARIDENDATFVDVIHTDILFSGLLQPIGHIDFYPNTGLSQPNCGDVNDMSSYKCNHMRASQYYAESVSSDSKFWAFACTDLYSYIKEECKPNDNVEELGYNTPQSARGIYFLATNTRSPYAKGKDFSNMEHGLTGKTFLGDEMLRKIEALGEDGLRNLTGRLS